MPTGDMPILPKTDMSEADFDAFDRAFLDYFKDVPFQLEVSQELLDWLEGVSRVLSWRKSR